MPMSDYVPISDEAITVDTAIGFTAAKLAASTVHRPADAALITVETATARYRLTGDAPSSTVGHLLAIGDSLFIEGAQSLANFRIIKVSGNASIYVTYFQVK